MTGITIRGLAKEYPRNTDLLRLVRRPFRRDFITALHGIDLDLRPGRIYGLVGPNGAGKTTLLKILAGLVLPTAGRILVEGRDVVASAREIRMRIAFVVANERSFFWRLSLVENLRLFATLQQVAPGDRVGRIRHCLDAVGLSSLAADSYSSLSTGMRQRLAIARGLLSEPRILLLDEATRSLDPDAAANVRSLVRELVDDDPERLVVYSSHNLNEVQDLCDDLLVLRKGKIVAAESLRGVRQDGALYYRIVLREVPSASVDDVPGVECVDEDATELVVRVQRGEDLDRLIDRLRSQGAGIEELTPIGRSIEERFFDQPRRST